MDCVQASSGNMLQSVRPHQDMHMCIGSTAPARKVLCRSEGKCSLFESFSSDATNHVLICEDWVRGTARKRKGWKMVYPTSAVFVLKGCE